MWKKVIAAAALPALITTGCAPGPSPDSASGTGQQSGEAITVVAQAGIL